MPLSKRQNSRHLPLGLSISITGTVHKRIICHKVFLFFCFFFLLITIRHYAIISISVSSFTSGIVVGFPSGELLDCSQPSPYEVWQLLSPLYKLNKTIIKHIQEGHHFYGDLAAASTESNANLYTHWLAAFSWCAIPTPLVLRSVSLCLRLADPVLLPAFQVPLSWRSLRLAFQLPLSFGATLCERNCD